MFLPTGKFIITALSKEEQRQRGLLPHLITQKTELWRDPNHATLTPSKPEKEEKVEE